MVSTGAVWRWANGRDKPFTKAAILHAFCFGAIFNMIVLAHAKDWTHSFPRVVFFCLIFRLLSGGGEITVLAVSETAGLSAIMYFKANAPVFHRKNMEPLSSDAGSAGKYPAVFYP